MLRILFLLFFVCLFLHSEEGVKNSKPFPEGVPVAEKWLQLLDQGQYAKSWEEASSELQSNVTQEQWVFALETVRGPLGHVLSREFIDSQWDVDQEGEWSKETLVLKFLTTFAEAKEVDEQVSLVRYGTREWKVLGYHVD